ncbi:uracil-DNA glycosylase [Mycoplasmatota bacterium]|nr:uracil-DNA glycosylase [Mycoplasmatota bacterium]
MKNSIIFENDWDLVLSEETNKPYFIELMRLVEEAYQDEIVYPKYENLFNALKLTPFHKVKVVIIGQDPYHQKNQAHGLSFSVPKGEKIPKSLHNIYLELCSDLNVEYPEHGNLISWANQGVLLLNTVLTVCDSKPGSHRNIGWENFTNEIILKLNKKETPVVYLLWGNDAKKKESLILNNNHHILKSVHPSPLSAYRGFFGCKHFSKTNQILKDCQIEPINWQI